MWKLDRESEAPEVGVDARVSGSIQVLMILLIFFFSFSGFGIWGFLRHWRFLVEDQFELDRCVGKSALDFRDSLNSIETSNRRIQELRASILLVQIQPELIPPLQLALQGVVLYQEKIRNQWEWKRVKRFTGFDCSKRRDQAEPLPRLEFVRDPPDELGSQILHWPGTMPMEFYFRIVRSSRGAAARVFRNKEFGVRGIETDEIEAKTQISEWKAEWSSPRRKRPSFN